MPRRIFAAALMAASLHLTGPPATAAQAPTLRDVIRIVTVSYPRFSPGDKSVAYVERPADLDSDEYRTEMRVLDVSSGKDRPLRQDRRHASAPAGLIAGR